MKDTDFIAMEDPAMVYNYVIIVIIIINLYSLDVDECAEDISGCNQECVNTVGSYVCLCYTGYQFINGSSKICHGV